MGQFEHKSSVIGPTIEQTDDRFSNKSKSPYKVLGQHPQIIRTATRLQSTLQARSKTTPSHEAITTQQQSNTKADRKHNITAHKRKKSACVGLRIHKHNTIMRRSQNRHASACLLDSASSFSRQHHKAKATTNYTPSPALLAKLSLASVVTNSHAQHP